MKLFLWIIYTILLIGTYLGYCLHNNKQCKKINVLQGTNTKKTNLTPVLFFSIPFIVYSLIGTSVRITDQSVSDSSYFMFVFINLIGFVSFLFGYGKDVSFVEDNLHMKFRMQKIVVKRKIPLLEGALTVLFVLFVIINIDRVQSMIVGFGTGANYLDYSIRSGRTTMSGITHALSSYFSLFMLALPVYRCYKKNKITFFDLFVVVMLFSWALFSGDRTTLILIAIIVLILINERYFYFNMRFICIGAIVGVFLLVLLGHLRRYNSLEAMLLMLQQENILALFSLQSSGEFKYTTGTLLTYIKNIDSFLDFGYFKTYFTEILMFIPTLLFPNRPLPLAEQYMLDFFPTAQSGTGHGWFILTTGYMSFGIVGVVIEMFLYGRLIKGVFVKFFDGKIDPMNRFLYSYFLLYIFYSIRSSMIITVKNYIIAVFPLILICFLYENQKKKKRRNVYGK